MPEGAPLRCRCAQFLALAARAMRRALVGHARHRGRVKRGGGEWLRVTLDPEAGPVDGCATRDVEILGVHSALEKLERLDECQVRVVDLKMFSGPTIDETAEVLGVSTDMVEDDWAIAGTWLWRELEAR